MSSSNKIELQKGTSYLYVCGPEPHTPPPAYTLYTCIPVYSIRTYSHREWGEGGSVEPQRKGEGQQFTKLGLKYQQYCLYLQSIKFDKHLPQSPFTGHFFADNDVYKVN
jgi:hypothetical protein